MITTSSAESCLRDQRAGCSLALYKGSNRRSCGNVEIAERCPRAVISTAPPVLSTNDSLPLTRPRTRTDRGRLRCRAAEAMCKRLWNQDRFPARGNVDSLQFVWAGPGYQHPCFRRVCRGLVSKAFAIRRNSTQSVVEYLHNADRTTDPC